VQPLALCWGLLSHHCHSIVVTKLKELSTAQLKGVLKVSDNLARLNADRMRTYNLKPTATGVWIHSNL
jgi:cytoplasmic iron level regulating protein YaaA (DUF328/UPF0246 family)